MAKKLVISANALAQEVAQRSGKQSKWHEYRAINEFIESGGTIDKISPATKSILKKVIEERQAQLDEFVKKLFV